MGERQVVTFCRICEAHCGLVATVEDDRVTRLRPDPDHPLSRGYACPKGIAMAEVQNDADRVLHPLRRRAGGGFERVGWDEALADIGERLRGIPPESIGWYFGNPGAFSYSHTLWVKGLLDAIGSPHYYTAGSQDVNNRFAASALLYGSPLVVPIPDLARTSFLLMIGANPLVSHGSVLSAPRVRDQLVAITGRGGRVVVVDPRRTETARAFEHLPIRPDADAWLLLSMIHTILDESRGDGAFADRWCAEVGALHEMARAVEPADAAARTGLAADDIAALARDFARAPGAAAYGRTGSCLGRFGTLVAFLIDALNAVTGNLDKPGGAVFGRPPVALDELAATLGLDSYGRTRSRVGGFPDVLGNMPASLMARDIEDGAVRALFVSAGNPVLSVPDGGALEGALGKLDLAVSLDLYVNETNRHADYVLPATTFLERDDVPLAFLGFFTKPFIQQTDAVVPPAGEARDEWEVIEALGRSLGVTPSSVPALRALGRIGVRLSPRRLLDLLIRLGPDGDWLGLRRKGLSLRRLRSHPHGLVLGDSIATGVLGRKIRHPEGRLRLAPAAIRSEARRLGSVEGHDPSLPLRLIGLRELRSHNSWMHNAPLLMRGGRVQSLRVHPDDAAEHGLEDGGDAVLTSGAGTVTVPVTVTDEMVPGVVALPHGWGHRGGWRLANAHSGVNVNLLASAAPEDLEPLAGMAFLNGIPVRVEPVASPRMAGAATRGTAA